MTEVNIERNDICEICLTILHEKPRSRY